MTCIHLWSAPAPCWHALKAGLIECTCHLAWRCEKCGVERVELTGAGMTNHKTVFRLVTRYNSCADKSARNSATNAIPGLGSRLNFDVTEGADALWQA